MYSFQGPIYFRYILRISSYQMRLPTEFLPYAISYFESAAFLAFYWRPLGSYSLHFCYLCFNGPRKYSLANPLHSLCETPCTM